MQYFYEPFLAAYDPVLRKRLGVWFTPPDVVRYMVARIDKVLREQLHVANGFADPNVFVLDPCCGTGAFLVEVLRQIETTLKANGGDALTAEDIKTAAMERVFGFELLPAPFVVSHLQLGLLLQNLGAPLSEKLHERVGVYLTNALTGWNPPKGPKQKLMFPEMEEERDAAELVKRDKTILVVLGNPPYYAFAGVSPEEEQGLVEPYKEGLGHGMEDPQIQSRRAVCALSAPGRAAHRGDEQARHRLLHFQLLVSERSVLRCRAQAPVRRIQLRLA